MSEVISHHLIRRRARAKANKLNETKDKLGIFYKVEKVGPTSRWRWRVVERRI